jgi:N-methylhydantoinase A
MQRRDTMKRWRIGVDIGGTFTDVTGLDEETAEVFNLKVLTTSRDPEEGVLEALDQAGTRLNEVYFLSHGTTIAINALLEAGGARTALITTKGFRDILELRRGARTHVLNPLMDKPPIFVPRRWRVEVTERIASDGAVLQNLDAEEVREVISHLKEQGMLSVAVCLMHSYINPVHEQMIAELLKQLSPHIYCTLSCELSPEIGEYERTSTSVLNAYIQPVAKLYLTRLETELKKRGLQVNLNIMQSNGGIMSAHEAGRRPIYMLESGPAGGSIAAAHLGRVMGISNVITLDMGGTTTKSSVIEHGEPLRTMEFELFESHNKPGSGWPVRVPMIDIFEIGAGGGSIAWLDEGGVLHVGPHSAGAVPGPVCYDKGGVEPTITDANAVLGCLVTLLGGNLMLNVEKARRAIQERIARPLALSVEEAAAGILQIANAKAADVIREVTIARGRDPRDFTLVAFGGAGPLEAAYVIGELGLQQAIIPPVPGNFSAMGLLSADIIHETTRAYATQWKKVDISRLNTIYQEMEEQLSQLLSEEGVAHDRIHLVRSIDMRYMGQFHILNVALAPGELKDSNVHEIQEAFHQEHLRLYTYQRRGQPTEVVNLRVRGVGLVPRPQLRKLRSPEAQVALKGTRGVYFHEAKQPLETFIYARDLLVDGAVLKGPAIIEEQTSTTLLPPGFAGTVDPYGNIILRRFS